MRRLMLAALSLGLAAGGVWLVLRDGTGEGASPPSNRETARNAASGAVLVGRAVEGENRPDPDVPAAPPIMATLSGAVVYPDDTPASGVEVVIRALHEAGGAEHRVTTDAAGRFEVRLVEGAAYRAYVPNRSVTEACWPGDDDVRLVVRVPSRDDVLLRILDPHGTPVPRVEVSHGRGNLPFTESTEVEGGSVFLDAEEGDEVTVREPRDADGRRLNLNPVWWRLSGEREQVVRLQPGRRLDGIVRSTDGRPLVGVRVRVDAHTFPGGVNLQTDAEGRFASMGAGRLEGHVRIDVSPPKGYLSPGIHWIPPETSHVELELVRGHDIAVRVVDPKGRPAARVGVLVRGRWQGRRLERRGSTDADGRARMVGLPPGQPVDVLIGVPKAWPWIRFRDLMPCEQEIELSLQAGVTIRGEVRGEDDAPIPRAWIRAVGLDDGMGDAYHLEVEGARSTFELGPLLPGRYRLLARVQEPYADPVPIEVDAPAEDLVIVAPKAVTLEGSFVGKGLVRPQIRFFSTAGEAGDVRSVQGGAFRLTGLRNEPGILYAYEEKTDRCWIRYDVRPSEGPFEIRLEEGHRVAGRLEGFDRHTSPWTGVTLYSGLFRLNSSAARDGTFVFHAVPPGTYEIRLWPNDHERVVHQGIEAGATDLVFPMPPERNAR